MVDVGDKSVTERKAVACAEVLLPPEVAARLEGNDIQMAKGPVFHTASLAGIMAAKRTSDLIPLCHPLFLDNCKVHLSVASRCADGAAVVRVECQVRTHGRTGVEMEALTGASVAALTVYDMCKALSHSIVIRDLRLVSKTGGKSDYLSP